MPKPPALTLRDPETKKTADLSDEQAVRGLLAEVINRISKDDTWKNGLPKDSTERVAAEILRKAETRAKALAIVKEAETLHAIFQGTGLEEDMKGVPKPKKGEKTRGLFDEKALEKHLDDVAEAVRALWPTYRQSIEESEGTEKKVATVKVEFVPETDDADAYLKVVAETKVSTSEITRTSKVRRLTSGRHQLELFDSAKID